MLCIQVDEEGAKAEEARVKASLAFAEAHSEHEKAQEHRDRLDEQRLDDKIAAAEQQLNKELAEKAKAKAEKEAKKEALKEEALKAKQLEASLAAEIKASEARQRSAVKSIGNDNLNLLTTTIVETFQKGEAELDMTFDSGVDAGIAHEAQAEKARREAAMAKVTLHGRATRPSPNLPLGCIRMQCLVTHVLYSCHHMPQCATQRLGKSKVLEMAAEIENSTAKNTTVTTSTPAPASASSSEAKPRRSARVASNTNA